MMNDFQKQIWKNNYIGPNQTSIFDTFKRVAKSISSVQVNDTVRQMLYENIYKYLSQFKFVGGGRITSNIGIQYRTKATLYNCYVYHPYDFGVKDIDSIQCIFDSLKKSAKILASQGGLGINPTFIRPNGTFIKGTGVRTPGVLKFLQMWDKCSQVITSGTTKSIKDKNSKMQKKKIRKGAQLSALDISHPQIKQYIKVKQTPNRLTKFNLSVLIPNRFMQAVINDDDWHLCFPDTEYQNYTEQWDGDLQKWIINNKPTVLYQTIKARQIWDLIMLSTYNRNEPGILFYDLINDYNPTSYCQTIITTNPCGEIPQSSNVCNLGFLNLTKFIKDDLTFDFEQFQSVVRYAVMYLDNVCDISYVPLDQYKQKILDYRRIGLGVSGQSSMLMMMGIKFGSEQAIQLINKISKCKAQMQILTSAVLGKTKGSFRKFDKQKYFSTHWWKTLPISEQVKQQVQQIGQMRNAVHSANAPTGNGSIFAGQISNGIQPVFMKYYTRWVTLIGDQKEQLQKKHKQICSKQNYIKIPQVSNGQWYQTQIFKFNKRGNQEVLVGSINDITYQIDRSRGIIKPMQVMDYGYKFIKDNNLPQDGVIQINELTVKNHLDMLEASAKYVDQNQSKTINIPEDYSYQDFKQVYFQAWKRKIKGITTYRTGTMTAVIQDKDKKKEYQTQLQQLFTTHKDDVIKQDVKIPQISYSLQYKVKDKNKKKWYITLSFADKFYKFPFAMFIRTNNKQSNQVADRVIQCMQNLLRVSGIDQQLIQLQRDKYNKQTNVDKIGRAISMSLRHNIQIQKIVDVLQQNGDGLSTLLFHVRKILSNYIQDGTKIQGKECPNCGSTNMVYQEGCSVCLDCGNSKCS